MEYVEYIRKGVKRTKKFSDFDSARHWIDDNSDAIITDWYNVPLPKSLTNKK